MFVNIEIIATRIKASGGTGGRKKDLFGFPEIKFCKFCKLQNLQNLFFRIGKSIILLPPVPPTKNYISRNQMIIKLASRISCKRGGEGGVKMSFFGFQKMNFNNSAICGIIESGFLRTKKERFLSTLSTLESISYW